MTTTEDINISNEGLSTAGAIHVQQYTRLGEQSAALKIKTLESTSAATQGGSNTVAHGLDARKIVSVEGLVRYDTNNLGYGVPDSYNAFSGFELTLSWNATQVSILNEPGNSSQILSKPVVITIMYIE